MRVLVVDMVHGGDILARRYVAEGDDVTCCDVYGVAPAHMKEDLREYGIRVLDRVPPEEFDITVMPTHCSRSFLEGSAPGEIRSFSREVGRLIEDRRFRIEVTGVKGKTSACYLISKMLYDSGRTVLLHSSRGEGPWTESGHRIDSKVSIAPPYIMTLQAGRYDAIVCEVSLGGSGKADIACITNLAEDYGIAKNTLKASDAKKDIFCGDVNIVPREETGFWSEHCDDLTPYGGRISMASAPRLGKGLKVSVDYDGISEITLDGSYIQTEYIGAMELALEVCHSMGVPADSVLRSLEDFRGIPGRGEIAEDADRIVVRERNPGISHISIDRTLSCLKEMGGLDGAFVIIDPVSRKVCDKMDMDMIGDVVSGYGLPMIVTNGDGTRPDIPEEARVVVEFIKEGYQ